MLSTCKHLVQHKKCISNHRTTWIFDVTATFQCTWHCIKILRFTCCAWWRKLLQFKEYEQLPIITGSNYTTYAEHTTVSLQSTTTTTRCRLRKYISNEKVGNPDVHSEEITGANCTRVNSSWWIHNSLFTKSKFYVTEKLMNGALVTFILFCPNDLGSNEWSRMRTKWPSSERRKNKTVPNRNRTFRWLIARLQ